MDYHPSELARSLIQRRSFSLGIVTAGLNHIGPNRTLNGITTRAEELGYAIVLKQLSHFTVGKIRPILQSLIAREVDGILWAVPEVNNNREWLADSLEGVHIPIIFLGMSHSQAFLGCLSTTMLGESLPLSIFWTWAVKELPTSPAL